MRSPVLGRGGIDLCVLVIENLVKRYGGTVALDGVSLDIREGEIHALVGENGSGKSTLCKVLFGDVSVAATGGYEGRIVLSGEPVSFSSSEDALDHGVVLVHQELSLIAGMTIAENVMLGREPVRTRAPLASIDRHAAERETARALADVGLQVAPGALTGELPISTQQLVEAARAFSRSDIKVLVLDEPSAALSTAESEALVRLMRTLARTGVGILLVSHRLSEVIDVADRVTVLRDGRVAGTFEASAVTVAGLARLIVGEGEAAPVPRVRTTSSAKALSLHDLRVAMPGDPLRGLSLAVHAGEIVGITSQAGHGRLALGNGLLGIYPAHGSVCVSGASVTLGDVAAMERAGMSVVHEDRREVGLDTAASVALNIALPSLVAGRRFVRAAWLPGGGFPDHVAIDGAAEALVERFDIRCTSVKQPVGELSGGNQQKVAIARGVASEPAVLVVVEPTRGVDVRVRTTVLEALCSIADEGVGVLVVSGEVGELERVCDRIVVLREGRAAAEYAAPFDAVEIELAVLGEHAEVECV